MDSNHRTISKNCAFPDFSQMERFEPGTSRFRIQNLPTRPNRPPSLCRCRLINLVLLIVKYFGRALINRVVIFVVCLPTTSVHYVQLHGPSQTSTIPYHTIPWPLSEPRHQWSPPTSPITHYSQQPPSVRRRSPITHYSQQPPSVRRRAAPGAQRVVWTVQSSSVQFSSDPPPPPPEWGSISTARSCRSTSQPLGLPCCR